MRSDLVLSTHSLQIPMKAKLIILIVQVKFSLKMYVFKKIKLK